MKPKMQMVNAFMVKTALGFLALLTLTLATAKIRAAELTVFAAASLSESLHEIASNYEKQSGEKVIFNLGASSTLARQIEEGAPADVFFSADEAKMDGLEKKGLILKETRKSRLSNSLVIVVGVEAGAAIERPQRPRYGQSEAACAGRNEKCACRNLRKRISAKTRPVVCR